MTNKELLKLAKFLRFTVLHNTTEEDWVAWKDLEPWERNSWLHFTTQMWNKTSSEILRTTKERPLPITAAPSLVGCDCYDAPDGYYGEKGGSHAAWCARQK